MQGAGRRAAALPTGYRVNLALYSLVLIGIGLIAIEVRGENPPLRQVQTLPRLATDTTRLAPVVDPSPPTVLGPGDLTPTPPPAVTPGGVVVGQPGPAPNAPGAGANAP
ncbi:MAG: hypothetical protein ACRD12_23975, partial [Acidimicrobiales bacterium]